MRLFSFFLLSICKTKTFKLFIRTPHYTSTGTRTKLGLPVVHAKHQVEVQAHTLNVIFSAGERLLMVVSV